MFRLNPGARHQGLQKRGPEMRSPEILGPRNRENVPGHPYSWRPDRTEPAMTVAAQSMTSSPSSKPGGAAVIEKQTERVRKLSPRYKVLLHNDPVNTMEYVVSTLRQVVPSLSEQDAIAVMLETHNTGVGLVIVCDIEPAEFYCETLKAKGLSSTIEPEG